MSALPMSRVQASHMADDIRKSDLSALARVSRANGTSGPWVIHVTFKSASAAPVSASDPIPYTVS